MPVRSTPLVTGEFYHIYNRGIARQPVFLSKRDYERFILTLSYYRFLNPPVKLSRLLQLPEDQRKDLITELEGKKKKLVNIVSFVLIPNHFHLLLKQTAEQGISHYMRRTVNSWARYFNTKYNRPGALFQGAFKAIHIETDEQLIHLSRYIHLNPLVSYVVKEKDFLSYPWSSLPDYLSGKSSFVELGPVLNQFSSSTVYQKFVLDQADYAKSLEAIKHLVFEERQQV